MTAIRVPYTPEEVRRLKATYNTLGISGLDDIIKRHGLKSVQSRARQFGLANKTRPRNREDMIQFKKVTDPRIAYLLGFLWADGHVPIKGNVIMLLIGEADGETLKELICSTAKSWHGRAFDGYGKSIGKRYIDYQMSSYDLKQYLIGLDYHVKSRDIPMKVLATIPDHLKHYWWRGYFDGDGCFHFGKADKRGMILISAPAGQDWSFVVELLTELGADHKIRNRSGSGGSSSCLCLQSETAIRAFCDYIYSGEQMGLHRKRVKYEQYLEHKKRMAARKSSPYRGVFWDKGCKRWKMQICKDKVLEQLYFDDPKEAALEYNRLAKKLHGNKARLNHLT